MNMADQVRKLQAEISSKAQEYHRLLLNLRLTPPSDRAELFKMKRKLINLSREKVRLIEEFKHLDI